MKHSMVSLGAALALAGIAWMGSPGNAVASIAASSTNGVLEATVNPEQIRHRRYRRDRHGRRFHRRRRGYRHRYRGWYYSYPWWLHVAPPPRRSYGRRHVRWCLNRFRSYNPRTDRYLGYDGYYHRCRSPFSY